jgi:hypothetical protein
VESAPAPEAATPVDAAPQAAPATSWESAPLPEGHPGLAKGFKTWGDQQRSYQSSSDEAHRLREENEERRIREALLLKVAQRGQPGAPAAPAAPVRAPGVPAGFSSVEEFNALKATDPMEAVWRNMKARMVEDPELAQRLVTPHVQGAVKPLEEQARAQMERQVEEHMARQAEALAAEFPEARPGTPQYAAAQAWIRNNRDHALALRQMAERNPEFNAPRTIYLLATAEMDRAVARAAQQRAAQTRARSGVAIPGSGAAAHPSDPKTLRGKIEAEAAKLRAQGQEIPESWVGEMEAALQRHNLG